MVSLPIVASALLGAGIAGGVSLVVGIALSFLSLHRKHEARLEAGRPHRYSWWFRLGGVALAAGAGAALAWDERLVWDTPLFVLVWGAGLALTMGIIDDRWPLHWGWQLAGQIGLGAWVALSGMVIQHIPLGGGRVVDLESISLFPGLAIAVTVMWVVLVMNALNWIDGTDGLMGSVVGVVFLAFLVLSFKPVVNQPAMVLLSSICLGSILGFLFLNWYPAKLQAGTSGVAFLGFLVAALAVYAGAKVATALMVLALPILDLVSVLMVRLRHGQSPFLPDRNHLHHILLSFGWKPPFIALLYTGATGLMAGLALLLERLDKLLVFGIVGAIFFGVVGWMQWTLNKLSQSHQHRHHAG